jgi:hypothetical protein
MAGGEYPSICDWGSPPRRCRDAKSAASGRPYDDDRQRDFVEIRPEMNRAFKRQHMHHLWFDLDMTEN